MLHGDVMLGNAMRLPHGVQSMSDVEIIALAQHGSDPACEYLLAKYHSLVEQKAHMYFLAGADREDIVQEGMIGLFRAIYDYRADRQVPCRAFAELCIRRRVITAVKAANRQKHLPLNSYVSLHATIHEPDSDQTLLDTLADVHVCDPEDIVIAQLLSEEFRKSVQRDLSDLELAAMHLYIRGLSFKTSHGSLISTLRLSTMPYSEQSGSSKAYCDRSWILTDMGDMRRCEPAFADWKR